MRKGIKKGESSYPQLNDRGWLYQKYWVEELSISQIADIVGCSHTAVWLALTRLNIPKRTISDALRGNKNPRYGKHYPKEESPMFGKHHRKASKQKIGDANRGKKGWNKGLTKEDNEGVRRISESKKGEGNPNFGKKGINNPQYRKPRSKKTKQKISNKMKQMYQDPEFAKKMHQATAKRPTKPEKMWHNIAINKHSLPFKYTGNGEVVIGGKCPDFVHLTKKVVIEIFGKAFHSPLFTFRKKMPFHQTYEGTIKHYKRHGYKCVIFWDRDLLREDAEQFILSILKKERII